MLKRTLSRLFLSAVFILLCTCSLLSENAQSEAGIPGDQGKGPTPSSPQEPIFANQGDLVRDGDIRLMVHGWMEIGETVPKTPEPGNKYIAVDFTVVNAGSKCPELFGMRGDADVVDSEGNRSGPFEVGPIRDELIRHGGVCPGEKIRRTIIYQVKEASKQFSFYFTNDRLPELAPITVALSENPDMSDPPEAIEGEKAPEVESMDQPITRGDWQIQVRDMKVSQPCLHQGRPPSNVNCMAFLKDGLDVRLDLSLKNTSSETVSFFAEGMLWLQDPTGRRFSSGDISQREVGGGEEIRFSGGISFWPESSVLWLCFRYAYWEKPPANWDYVCIALPTVLLP